MHWDEVQGCQLTRGQCQTLIKSVFFPQFSKPVAVAFRRTWIGSDHHNRPAAAFLLLVLAVVIAVLTPFLLGRRLPHLAAEPRCPHPLLPCRFLLSLCTGSFPRIIFVSLPFCYLQCGSVCGPGGVVSLSGLCGALWVSTSSGAPGWWQSTSPAGMQATWLVHPGSAGALTSLIKALSLTVV